MAFEISESIYLNEITSTTKYINSSLLEKVGILNKIRSGSRFHNYGIMWISKIIEDQPTKSIRYDGLTWKNGNFSVLIYKQISSGEYVIEYPVATETEPNNINGSVMELAPTGAYRITRSLSKFGQYPETKSYRYYDYNPSGEHTKLLRYLKSIYERAWLDLKRKKVTELKKEVTKDSIDEYYASKNATKTVAVMQLARATTNLMNAIESYRTNIGKIKTASDAAELYKNVEREFILFRSEHLRKNWNSLKTDGKIPGGKTVTKVLVEEKKEND